MLDTKLTKSTAFHPKLMAKQRSSLGWSYTLCICTDRRIHTHGMKASPMSSTATIELSIAQLVKFPFRWGWDSNHYVPLMWPYNFHLRRSIQLMSNLKMTRLTTSFSTFNTSASRSMTYLTCPMLSTSSIMISIGCHTSSRWATKFGYICRRSTSLGPIASFPPLIWALHHH